MEVSGKLSTHLVSFEKPLNITKNTLITLQEMTVTRLDKGRLIPILAVHFFRWHNLKAS